MKIPELELDLYIAGEPVTVPGCRYIVNLGSYETYHTANLFSRDAKPMEWRVVFEKFTLLEEDDSDRRPGWCGIVVSIWDNYGAPVAPVKPHMLYGRPWWHSSLMVWPNAWVGPVVLAARVPAMPGRKCNAIYGVNASLRCVLDEWHPDVPCDYRPDPRLR